MDETEDKQEILNQMLKRWQDQVAHSLNDPETVSKSIETMYVFQKSYLDLMKKNHESTNNDSAQTKDRHEATCDSASAADAYDGVSCDECVERIARLERRIEHLESSIFRIRESAEL
ncbi:MAG: hypothetical protein MK137_00200 [Rickettsiales bacterium]|nr:hypothetical protein [Rickettsiales bacterium]